MNDFKYEVNTKLNYMVNVRKMLGFAIKGISLALIFTIVTIIFVPLLLTIATYIGQVLLINEYNLSLLSSSLTITLVVITAVYVYLTHKIVLNSEKERKISFIERKLEKFYYPLLKFIEININVVSSNDVFELRVRNDVFYIDNRKSDPYYKDFIIHQYLSTKKVREEFNKFFEILSQSKTIKKENDIDVYKNLINDINIEIENLSNDLNDLVEPQVSHFESVSLIFIIMLFYFVFMFLFISSNIPTRLL